jgi:hydrogenase maturation protease
VIGLGNEFLADDGVGIRVVRELTRCVSRSDVVFEELSVGGLGLLDYVTGSDECIIIDAVVTGTHHPGTIYRFVQAGDCAPASIRSTHQLDLAQVLSLATLMGADVPRTITVYGIEAEDITTFRETCTDPVSRAIPLVVEILRSHLEGFERGHRTPTGTWEIMNEAVIV